MAKVFLIYIPCHKDFDRARDNALKIRSQVNEIQGSSIGDEFKIHVTISVNGVDLPPNTFLELSESADQLVYFPETLGGDTNINLGFLNALQLNPDYFWILSANEFLVEGSIKFIFESIISNRLSDLYVTNSMSRISTYTTSNVFIDIPSGSGFGLISSVIYNFKNTHKAFSAGPRFAWTGWGQLAVLQTACNILGNLKVTEFPDSKIYQKPFTDVGLDSSKTEHEFVQTNYAHSYFGMVILIFALFGHNKRTMKKVLLSWLKKNWFQIHYFRKGAARLVNTEYPQFDPRWVQKVAGALLLRAGFVSATLTCLGNLFDFEKARENKFLVSTKKRIYRS